MIKRMVSGNGRRVKYRAYIPGMKMDFNTFDEAFGYIQDRIGKDNLPVIKSGCVVWWDKRFKAAFVGVKVGAEVTA